jgi:hypothetical protein
LSAILDLRALWVGARRRRLIGRWVLVITWSATVEDDSDIGETHRLWGIKSLVIVTRAQFNHIRGNNEPHI